MYLISQVLVIFGSAFDELISEHGGIRCFGFSDSLVCTESKYRCYCFDVCFSNGCSYQDLVCVKDEILFPFLSTVLAFGSIVSLSFEPYDDVYVFYN